MQPTDQRRKMLTIISLIFGALVIAAIIIAIVVQLSQKNEYGDGIKIQNFDEKVKNVSKEIRYGIEATLYNVTEKNVTSGTNLKKVDDAFIRDNSEKQDYNKKDDLYSGNFIVDMESIKQSYFVQYTYVKDKDNKDGFYNRVVISCVEEKDLKYGAFKCADFFEKQATQNASIIQYLPHSNFSFKLAADTTDGDENLILMTELRIPETDLKGDLASKQNAVALYKNEVMQWIASKNLNPADYTYKYNYSDNGDLIELVDHDQHGNADSE